MLICTTRYIYEYALNWKRVINFLLWYSWIIPHLSC